MSNRMLAACATACSLLLSLAAAADEPLLHEPLPLHRSRSAIDHAAGGNISALSPDGDWLAHIYTDGAALDLQYAGAMQFTRTGVPPLDYRVPHARLTHTLTGEVIELAGPNAASWASTWSPDGTRVAFYSDEGGELGLWIWSFAARSAARVPGIIPRPHLAGQIPRWSPNGRSVLVTVLPEGMTIAQANARLAPTRPGEKQDVAAADESRAGVTVYRHPRNAPVSGDAAPVGYPIDLDLCDVAVVELATGRVRRIAREVRSSWFTFSPDGTAVAFAVSAGVEKVSTNQTLFDLRVFDFKRAQLRTVVAGVRSSAGTAFSWSADSRKLAYCTGGRAATGACFIADVAGGAPVELGARNYPPAATASIGYETAPVWAADGRTLYVVDAGTLWQLPIDARKPAVPLRIPEHEIAALVLAREGFTPWSNDDGRSLWISATGANASALYRWWPSTGRYQVVLQADLFHRFAGQVSSVPRAGRLLFMAQGPSAPAQAQLFDTAARVQRTITHFHEASRYELGRSRRLQWQDDQGERYEAMLLLPPEHFAGRHPLIVWLYPGDAGLRFYDEGRVRYAFGVSMPVFDIQRAATRGYAVLYPKVPLRPGKQADDVTRIVLAAVDAAVASAPVDSERLVVWGQSYGAYATQLLLTRTDRFKAAVTTGNVIHPDLFSAYLGDQPDSMTPGYFESGQGRLLATPWQDRDSYVRNSPLFHFDRVGTPLLMAQGTRDSTGMAALAPASAVFVALRRLDKPVELRVYEDEGHTISQPDNVADFWRRRLEFMAQHLGLSVDEAGRILPKQ